MRDDNCDPNLIIDIARQLIRGDVGSRLKVILGGGRAHFRNTTVEDEEDWPGYRTDGLDLIEEFLESKAEFRTRYVWNAVSFFSNLFCSNDLEINVSLTRRIYELPMLMKSTI